ncbi:uncharacterized protein LOC105692850 isoform X2 [Athalia rosae]|uniref:uncharacterized protein LOC105692850 isoform X2 n=1 Tax=Athalia rosae TaxID=37344 RepID=UPI00203438AE|nr:uncharacterized protein LOC105692850 isoform X2 [Athalia rosae]
MIEGCNMKGLLLYFYIILQMWKTISCEQNVPEDALSSISFTDELDDALLLDPFSFDYDRANKKMTNRQKTKSIRNNNVCTSGPQCSRDIPSESVQLQSLRSDIEPEGPFIKRLINLLLSNAKLKEDGDVMSGSVILSGTRAQIQKLREYGDGKVTIRQVDAIFSEILTPGTAAFTEALTLIGHICLTIHQYKGILMALCITIVTLMWIRYVNWSTGKVIVVFLAAVLLASFLMIWSQLIKDRELELLTMARKFEKPPVQCNPEKMYFWDILLTYLKNKDECLEYYKAIESNAFLEVTPLDALVEVFDRLILHPASRCGTVFGGFVENATKNLWFPMNWIVTIVLYIMIPAIVLMLALSATGGQLGVAFGPFFKFFIGRQQTQDTPHLQYEDTTAIGGVQKVQRKIQMNQLQQQASPNVERREPITVILKLESSNGAGQSTASIVTLPTKNNCLAIGAGDSQAQKQEVKQEVCTTFHENCCCGEFKSSNIRPVKRAEDGGNDTASKSESCKEKGDGDG